MAFEIKLPGVKWAKKLVSKNSWACKLFNHGLAAWRIAAVTSLYINEVTKRRDRLLAGKLPRQNQPVATQANSASSPYTEWEVNTSQSAVMLCNWGVVKASG